MSAILLSNTFATPSLLATPPPVAAAAAAVAPIADSKNTSKGGDASSFTGSGSGSSRQADNAAIFAAKEAGKWVRQPVPTGDSVVGAQAQSNAEEPPLGPDLPEVKMPDPLPTSPFLKWRSEDA